MTSPEISRRTLLYGAGGAAALLALGGAGRAFAWPAPALRPPGAQDDAFFASCIRCDRCRTVCPQGAITTAKLESGVVSVRTPIMNFRAGYCDECGGEYLCRQVCPTAALLKFDPQVNTLGLAVIDTHKCETYGISAACGAVCIDACLTEALSLDDNGRLVLDEASCWGCGACEYVCTANVYGVYNGSENRGINIVPVGENNE